eukprot:694438_1
MAYTASALSFMLDGLAKPEVLTGAQLPLGELFNDAKGNMIGAILVAASMEIPEVCVCFANVLRRGNRCSKVDSFNQDCFDSPNYPPLGRLGTQMHLEKSFLLPYPKRKLKCNTKLFTNIAVVWLIPGFSDQMFDSLAASDEEKALVLVCYGCGNAPVKKPGFRAVLRKLTENNTSIVVATQCPKGSVNMGIYDVSADMRGLGIISAQDMTIEACVTKLSYLMGQGLRGPELKLAMETNLRGELSHSSNTLPYTCWRDFEKSRL